MKNIIFAIKNWFSMHKSEDPSLDEREVVAFKPDPLEIEERAPPAFSFWALYSVLALIFIMIVWASLSEVDIVVTARGDMAMPERTVVVQPLETSIITSIRVSAGQAVSAGQLLGTLDPTFSEADVAQLQIRLSDLRDNIQRLESELAESNYSPNDESPSTQLQRTVYNERKAHFNAQLSAFDEQVARIDASIETNLGELLVLGEREKVLKELETMRTKLVEKGAVSKRELLEIKNERLKTSQEVKKIENSLYEQKHQLQSAASDKTSFIADWRRKIGEELVELRRNSSEVKEQLQKAILRESRVNLVAPLAGTVLEIADLNIGSVVQVAEPLFTIVPAGSVATLEVEIPVADIGFIKRGNEARVKLDAYPFQKHGTALGIVTTISEDAFSDESTGKLPMYRAIIELLDTDLRNVPTGFRLIPGMSGQAEIKVGSRKVISYFTYPFIRGLDESIREP